MDDEEKPVVGKRYLCRHPFDEAKRAYVVPEKIEEMCILVWDGSKTNPICVSIDNLV